MEAHSRHDGDNEHGGNHAPGEHHAFSTNSTPKPVPVYWDYSGSKFDIHSSKIKRVMTAPFISIDLSLQLGYPLDLFETQEPWWCTGISTSVSKQRFQAHAMTIFIAVEQLKKELGLLAF